MLPRVSIITATRNLIDAGRKDFFRQCVESVRMQDYPDIEHLIIDGASTDGTVALLQELGANFVSEPDTGVYNAFNKGIKKANGKYVAFLCSDDFYTRKDALSMVIQALERDDGDFTCAPVVLVEENGSQRISRPHWGIMLSATPFCTGSMFVSKKILNELNGFDERYAVFADYDFMIRAMQSLYRPIEIDRPFVAFRTNGISSNPKIQHERLNIIKDRFGMSDKQAMRAFTYGFAPFGIVKEFLKRNTTFPNPKELKTENLKRFLKYIRKQLITLHLRKGKRFFRLFGITFYDEVKS